MTSSEGRRRDGAVHRVSTLVLPILLTSLLLGVAAAACARSGAGGAEAVTDFGDRRRLVGFVRNVFVGRVVATAGARHTDPAEVRKPDDPGEPLTTVDVIENIKGALPERVTVIGPRLEPGRDYVFSTNPHPEGPWQIAVSRYGATAVRDGSHRIEIEGEFRRAYEEEIPYTPGGP